MLNNYSEDKVKIMENEYIDVEWTDCNDKSKTADKNINICTDPISIAVSNICGVFNNITNSVKEYNICKQQEETKRSEIKARLKLGLAEIQTKKEIILTQMNQEHELKMLHVKNYYNIMIRELETALDAVRTATEIARETKDFSGLIDIMKTHTEMSQIRSEFMLQYMNNTTGQNISGRISSGQTKYLE